MEVRLLKASEIECRVQQINEKGCSLLLYKDARVDMRLLDEVYGSLYWKREHGLVNGNLFCTVSVYNKEIGEWISKQDVGTESNTEKEKGQASDSFKRACVNLGIGRELYTAPFIWIKLDSSELSQKNGRYVTKTKFEVANIEYNSDREIVGLTIIDSKGTTRYTLQNKQPPQIVLTENQLDELYDIAKKTGYDMQAVDKQVKKKFGCKTIEMPLAHYTVMLNGYKKLLEEKEGK